MGESNGEWCIVKREKRKSVEEENLFHLRVAASAKRGAKVMSQYPGEINDSL